MGEIKLERRYPDSRPEDITDAYMRGIEFEHERMASESETEALRERVKELESSNMEMASHVSYAYKVMDVCTGELLAHKGIPYIIMPMGVIQALMEATAAVVGKRYDCDPPAFFGGDVDA